MGRGQIFPLDENDVVKLYLSGETMQFIANKYGCSLNAICNCIRRNGISKMDWKLYLWRMAGITPDELLAMYKSGMWKNEIAAKTGISEGAIGKYLSYLGIPLAKSKSDAMSKRLKRMTQRERDKLTKPAHDAVRGMKRTDEDLCKRALGKEKTGRFGSVAEKELFYLLKERGVITIPQKSIWKYNIDLAIGNIAVEITGRARKPENIPVYRERVKYILDAGFVLVYVWANTVYPVEGGAADYIISLIQQSSSDPSLIGQYRVIRRNGKLLAAGCSNDNDFTGIFTPVSGTFFKTRN